MLDIQIVETPGLGDRSYIVTDGEVAIVVDPQRDIDRILEAVDGVPITHVFETHIHNDYVTGGLVHAERCGAAHVVNPDHPVGLERHGPRDGAFIAPGTLPLTHIYPHGPPPPPIQTTVAGAGDAERARHGGAGSQQASTAK